MLAPKQLLLADNCTRRELFRCNRFNVNKENKTAVRKYF